MDYKLKGKKHIGSSNVRWKNFFVCFTLVQVIAVIAALAWLWISLGGAKEGVFHKDNPQLTADQIVQSLMAGDFSLLEQADGFVLSRYETQEMRESYLNKWIQSHAQSLLANPAGQQGDDLLYDVTSGDTVVAQLVLACQDAQTGYTIKEVRGVFEPLPEYRITAPVDAKLLVNGVLLQDDPVQVKIAEGFEDLPDGIPVPEVASYILTGLLVQPEVTAQEEAYQHTEQEDQSGVLFTTKISLENEQSRLTYVEKLARLYIQFVHNEIDYDALRLYLLPGGGAEKELSAFKDFLETSLSRLAFEQEQVLHIQQYDANTLMCEVSVEYVLTTAQGAEKQTVTVAIYLSRVVRDGPYYVHRFDLK